LRVDNGIAMKNVCSFLYTRLIQKRFVCGQTCTRVRRTTRTKESNSTQKGTCTTQYYKLRPRRIIIRTLRII